jgi:hypothetical protein
MAVELTVVLMFDDESLLPGWDEIEDAFSCVVIDWDTQEV